MAVADKPVAPRRKRAARPAQKAAAGAAPGAGYGAASEADNRVAVIGGGLAGLSAALRLSQAGFKVTLFEARPDLGGNLSSQRVSGVDHDVYPHMFCQWYDNFWYLFETDLGLSREEHFAARPGVKILDRGSNRYHDMLNATSIGATIANLRSGTMSMPEMFLLGFSMLDLAAHPFNRSGLDQLDKLDVNGFIYSRGYATEPVARMENYTLMLVWSIQSEQTAAVSYQDFTRHTLTYPDHSPFAWMLKGSLAEKIIDPLERKLRSLGCEIRHETQVTSIRLVDNMPEIRFGPAAGTGSPTAEVFDRVVLAVPPVQLAGLVMGAVDGLPGVPLVERHPSLAELRRLKSVPIPVVDIYFKRKLEGIPKEHIGLAGSRYDLTVLDISQLWTGPGFEHHSVLVVAASDADALASTDDHVRGFMMIEELNAYIGQFDPGTHWGDPDSDIDWEKTHFRSNERHPLFVNDVGSWEWRPHAAYPEKLPRVFFAGDFCRTDVDMATVESAVQSGILAAQALQFQDAQAHGGVRRGAVIPMQAHTVYSTAALRAAKLALLPLAYGAVAWAAGNQAKRLEALGTPQLGRNQYSLSEYSLVLPVQFALDWWKSAYWLYRSLKPGEADEGVAGNILHGQTYTDDCGMDAESTGSSPSDDKTIGIAAAALLIVEDALRTVSKALETRDDADLAKLAAGAGAVLGGLTGAAGQALQAVQAAWANSRSAEPPADAGPYKRRWRVKP